jgi:hypothetical protein
MANGNMGRPTPSSASSQKNNTKPVKTRKEVMDKIAFLEKDMARTKERMDNATNPFSRRTAESAYNRLMNSYDKAMIEYDNLPQEPRSQRAPQLTGSRNVKPAPRPVSAMDAEELAGRAAERPLVPSESTINRRYPIQEAACQTYYGSTW